MTDQLKPPSRVLSNFHHGGHVLSDDAPDAKELSEERVRISLASSVVPGKDLADAGVTSSFDYLFDQLAADFPPITSRATPRP